MRTTPVADAPSVAPARSRREGPTADPLGFSALLHETSARTAPAEGHIKKLEHDRPEHDRSDRHERTERAERRDRPERPEHPERRERPEHPAHPELPAHAVAHGRRERDAARAASDAPTGEPTASDAPASADGDAAASPTVPGATAPEPAPAPDPAAAVAVGGTATDPAAEAGAGAGGVTIGVDGAPAAPAPDADDLPTGTAADGAVTGDPATAGTAPTPGQAATPTTGDGTDTAQVAPALAAEAEGTATPVADGDAPTQDTAEPDTATGTPAGSTGTGTTGDGSTGTGTGTGTGTPTPTPEHLTGRARRAEVHALHGVEAATPATPANPTAGTAAIAATPASATTQAPGTLPEAWTSRGLAHTVERLADLVHVATARGVARAKMQLHPQELGGIEVRLRTSADGLVASITAQNADAVQAVTQAGAELRRSLEERGITIASLEINLAADGGGRQGWQRRSDAPGQARRTGAVGEVTDADHDIDLVPDAPSAASALPAGVLVDIHA